MSVAVRRASLAVDPAGVAIGIVLFFPDRQPNLDFVDNVAACLERLVPVSR